MVQTPPRFYTPEEYLERETTADYKSEYRDGEIVPMTGGTTNHNELALNLAATLKLSLRDKGYRVYMGDVRLCGYRQYTYPDYRQYTYPKSTQNYDQGDRSVQVVDGAPRQWLLTEHRGRQPVADGDRL
jgi:Uma2 family endonuclease